jgi:peptidoglycan biosynthesis protein MviN/MurJ (putative lipid II flippase)
MKNFFIVTFWSLINKYISLFRVQLTQRLLGTSMDGDAFHLAFKLISFFRRTFTDGSFYSFFSAFFINKNENGEKKYDYGFALSVLLIFSGIFIFISLLFFFFPLFLTKIFMGNNLPIEKLLLVSKYAKYMFPMALSMFLVTVFSSILNSYGEFFHSSFGLILGSATNVFIIYKYSNTGNVFWPFLIGTLSYSTIHAIYMGIIIFIKHFRFEKPTLNKQFYKKIFFTGNYQVLNNILFLYTLKILSTMKPGAYSYVEYSERLSMFIFMLVANNLSHIASPLLSKFSDSPSEYKSLCGKFFSMSIYLTIVPTVVMFFNSDGIIKAVYTANSKTNLSILENALKHVAVSIPFWNIKRMLVTFFMSKKEVKQSNISGLIYTIFNLILTFIFVKWNLFKYDHIGAIWAMNISVLLEIIYLFYESYKIDVFKLNQKLIFNILLKVLVAISIYYLIELIKNPFIFIKPMWFIILKALINFIIFALIFYKDTKFFFFKKRN